jgi:hypothetical protein
MKTIIKYSSLLAFLSIVIAMVFGNVEFADLFLMGGTAGTTYAVAIAGGVTTQNMKAVNTEVLEDPYEQMMTIMKPDDYPLDQLIRNTKKSYSWDAWKVTHPSVETRPISDTVASQSTATSDSTTPVEATIAVTTPAQWMVDDIVRYNGYLGANGKPLTGQITAKSGANLSIMAINGQGTNLFQTPIIAAATEIYRVGNAKDETAASTSIYNAVPAVDYNYMQIHMGQIEESVIYKLHAKNIKYDKALQKLLAMYNFRNEAESTALFGARGMQTDPTSSKTKYFSGGAEFFISNAFTYGTTENKTTFRETDWVALAKDTFTGNSGSSQRVFFAGKDLIERISNIDTVSKQMEADASKEVLWGVTFSRVQTKFGEFLIKYHKMFDYFGYAGKGMILDMNNIDKYVMEPFQKTALDLDKTAHSRVESERFHETSCFAFKYPDTHAIVSPHA